MLKRISALFVVPPPWTKDIKVSYNKETEEASRGFVLTSQSERPAFSSIEFKHKYDGSMWDTYLYVSLGRGFTEETLKKCEGMEGYACLKQAFDGNNSQLIELKTDDAHETIFYVLGQLAYQRLGPAWDILESAVKEACGKFRELVPSSSREAEESFILTGREAFEKGIKPVQSELHQESAGHGP